MKFFILLSFVTSTAMAAGKVELTPACEAELQERAAAEETAYLKNTNQTLASHLKAEAYLSYWPAKEDATVGVLVEDPADGRYVYYSAKVLKTDIAACKIKLRRDDTSACRYSSDDGPEGLLSIKGMSYAQGEMITPDQTFSDLLANQVRAFLGELYSSIDASELIRSTDDQELSSGTLTLPDSRKLSYFGAYGGDNPFGIFFIEGTTTVAGDNGDGSVCISPLK